MEISIGSGNLEQRTPRNTVAKPVRERASSLLNYVRVKLRVVTQYIHSEINSGYLEVSVTLNLLK